MTPDSPTQRVGGKAREGFVKVAHSAQMLSLDNAYNEEELRDWTRRVEELAASRRVEYECEYKLDGLSHGAALRGGGAGAGHHARRWDGGRGCDGEPADHPLRSADIPAETMAGRTCRLPLRCAARC